jgi:septal ring factor EnvC (AmiA/AmiB activator)
MMQAYKDEAEVLRQDIDKQLHQLIEKNADVLT